jgi:hypothetical protein
MARLIDRLVTLVLHLGSSFFVTKVYVKEKRGQSKIDPNCPLKKPRSVGAFFVQGGVVVM